MQEVLLAGEQHGLAGVERAQQGAVALVRCLGRGFRRRRWVAGAHGVTRTARPPRHRQPGAIWP